MRRDSRGDGVRFGVVTAARVTLLGVAYDASSSYLRGPAQGPRAIREALASDAVNGWSETGCDTRAPGVLADAGDVAAEESGAMRAQVESAVEAMLASGTCPLVLGGDHSISYAVLRAMRRRHSRLAILHLDAHADLYEAFEGDRYSHACPFARIMEDGLADRLVQMGIRTMNAHQRQQADRYGVEVHEMRAWDDVPGLVFDEPLYVSVDLDVLDPAFAPGVSHREPGGCSTRQLLRVLQTVRARVVGADVVECNPSQDPAGLTAWVGAKVARELVARMAA